MVDGRSLRLSQSSCTQCLKRVGKSLHGNAIIRYHGKLVRKRKCQAAVHCVRDYEGIEDANAVQIQE